MSLSQLLKERQAAQAKQKEQIELAKKTAQKCAVVLGDEVSEAINNMLGEIFKNQKLLDTETRKLQANSEKFVSQSQQWLTLSTNLINAFKELGDINHFLKGIAGEMKVIADACTVCAESGKI
ncbi:putative biogenesis of lysosome-related organelles complex 1 subunit 1 [Blattamonas nauphoetae]|uniref:Biogenesis of lysosome-related organelles complex 1 subunit 1 n=1 Tax=Blattamonas nauphoetae TaxID=2049346 RepID=A0ABQ9YEH6_9EUKA|nr:putative biogenesis of lysosome-related organelles complex 1 subunit 1 [Blattamonas nauphoetae]